MLGVCLGMQALVTAYGGRVDQVEPAHGEVALVEHDGAGVFEGLPSPFEAVRYHSLSRRSPCPTCFSRRHGATATTAAW